MQKKYLYLLFLLAVAVLLLPSIQPALALEVTYPTFLGTPNVNENPTLLNFIQYFFTFAIAVAGIIGVITIVIAGFKILISGGNPAEITDARESITGAALGIALLFASFILIRTINPTLVDPSLAGIPQQQLAGVILDTTYTQVRLSNGTVVDVPAIFQHLTTVSVGASENPNVTAPPDGPQFSWGVPPVSVRGVGIGSTAVQKIRYACTPPSATIGGPNLLVSLYDKVNFEIDRTNNGTADVKTHSLPCNNNPDNVGYILSTTKSYKVAIEQPGVYFYLKPCGEQQGISSKVYTTNSIIAPFDRKPSGMQEVKSMRIVNGRNEQGAGYGLILNHEQSAQGECSYPMLNDTLPAEGQATSSVCIDVPTNILSFPRYAYIFQHVPAPAEGTIKFQSQRLQKELNAGSFTGIDGQYNTRLYKLSGSLSDLLKPVASGGEGMPSLEGVEPGAEECLNGDQCLKKTRSNGHGFYRTIIYAANISETGDMLDDTCQVYTCQENFFTAANSGNRWIFDGRQDYNTFVIPMPGFACSSSQ